MQIAPGVGLPSGSGASFQLETAWRPFECHGMSAGRRRFVQGVAEDLAVDYELMAKDRPELVYVSITAYGEDGPLAELPGYEESAQAMTGSSIPSFSITAA